MCAPFGVRTCFTDAGGQNAATVTNMGHFSGAHARWMTHSQRPGETGKAEEEGADVCMTVTCSHHPWRAFGCQLIPGNCGARGTHW